MIRINLLPEEYRKKARTPVKLVLGLAAAVLINAGLVTWWAFQAFGVQAEIETEAASLQTEMDGLTPQVTYYSSLDSESKAYKTRESTLAAITSSRISWTKKLDELIDVVNRGGNGQRHMVWFDDLQVAQASDARAKTAGSFKATGHSGSEKFAQVANFLEDVETSTFIADFLPPSPPEGSQALADDSLVPSVAWSFPLSLTLKSPEERAGKKATDKGKKAPGAKPAVEPKAADDKNAAGSGEAQK
jgi:Tfp pilus assembly protein PilN